MTESREVEEGLLRSVLQQNAESIRIARQRAERELELAKQALEARTSELAASLALMQATLESTADGIVATDNAGRITGYNDRFLRMWGIADDLVSRGDHREVLESMCRQVIDSGRFTAGVDAILDESLPESFDVLELADGRVVERYTRTQRIDHRVIGRVWSYRDITERARAEADLRSAKAQAETANRAKSSFLAMMSHELRTPLNAIAGYADILQLGIHGSLTKQQSEALTRIQVSQRHLLGLIDGVLTHAKLETGYANYELTTVNALDAIANAQALLEPQAWASGVTMALTSCPPDLSLRADAEKLRQILLNLLSNAVKFTPRGGRIELEGHAAGARVHLVVRDSGVGIPAHMLDRIFEPFVQVRSELTRPASGTGLGLAISRTFARGMHGDLTVESESGRGSTFTLSLPAPDA